MSSDRVKPNGARTPPGADAGPGSDLERLGATLYAWREDVLKAMTARTRHRSRRIDPAIERRFERIGMVLTITAARKMAGESTPSRNEEQQESWLIFGELAAKRALPLNEAIERCLHWREAAEGTLLAITAVLQIPPDVHARALTLLQRNLTDTLIQMGEAFESAQRHNDQERTRREEELAFNATHDPLTGLPNRALIHDRLEQMLLHGHHTGATVAALFIDLDNFKRINDTHGHHTGDELLKAVAGRLTNAARDLDTLGRLGGDEFIVLASSEQADREPPAIAQRALESLGAPFALPDTPRPLQITASIGIDAASDIAPAQLLRNADIAMYHAKAAGKNRYCTFRDGEPSASDEQTPPDTQAHGQDGRADGTDARTRHPAPGRSLYGGSPRVSSTWYQSF